MTEFGDAEVAGGGRHAPHQVRDAYAEPGQYVLLGRRERSR